MYLDYDDSYWIIDIEGDGLPSNVVWCMCYENAITEEKGHLTSYEEIRDWFSSRPTAKFVGHHILGFDAPTLNRLVGCSIRVSNLVDTLILATLYNPALSGGHSLGAWGQRFGQSKIEFSDWGRLSDAMIEYCYKDVAITKMLFKRLVAVLNKIGFSEKSCEIQHKFMHVLDKQKRNGFYFDQPRALQLYTHIREREKELQGEIYHVFPPQLQLVKSFKRAYKATGEPTSQFERHSSQFPDVRVRDTGEYDAYDYVSFNLGSPNQRVQKLLELGWKPEEFTPKTPKGGGGNPKVTEKGELVPSLQRFLETHDIPEVHMIAKWIAFNGRGNMLGTWLDAFNPDTHCIHGNLQVAQTLRLRHDKPNTANIPAVRTDKEGNVIYGEEGYYTYEARDVWIARPGRRLVGTDAKALEYRMLAHHVNNREFTEVVLERDVHSFTQEMAGLPTRGNGKTLNFAVIYGSGDAKTGKIIGGTAKDGAAIKAKLFANVPGLGEAIQEAKSEFKAGRVVLVDGSKIVCPAEHAAFNYKLQGGGARVMAQGAIFLEKYIKEKGLDSLKVGDIHDEWQYDVDPKDTKEHAKWANQALKDAGEELNLNIPMEGESKEGRTWAETH